MDLENYKAKKPEVIIDLNKVDKNINKILKKFIEAGVHFRPHFKTHQCAAIGDIFREKGVNKCTVSSVAMARYFFENGWDDITLAVPVNIGELDDINELSSKLKLNLLVDNIFSAKALDEALDHNNPVWIKIDVGYGRVGVHWNNPTQLVELLNYLLNSRNLNFQGLLTHSGHTYNCRSHEEIISVFNEGRDRMIALKDVVLKHTNECLLSAGDTPSASAVENFDGIDEMRPGNFVFYDLSQAQTSSCTTDDIAIAMACPIIGKYEHSQKVAVYGGSVHLSKDSLMNGQKRLFGQLALPSGNSWKCDPESQVISCCQEVSTINLSVSAFKKLNVGDSVYILPAHSCLAAEKHSYYKTTDDKTLSKFVFEQ